MVQATNNILNVTLLEPRQKHPTIFARFDELLPGESLTIHNDHDPKPLYYQLMGERGNIFKWEYLEQGPVWWKVTISKKLPGEGDETLGQIAAKDLSKAAIFKKHGLDFCCGGKQTLQEACTEKGLDITTIENELNQPVKTTTGATALPYQDWSLGFLADFIVNTHHAYVRKTLPELRSYADKVMQVHGSEHTELLRVYSLTEEINAELSAHLVKEEKILFPYIKQLEADKFSGTAASSPFGTVQNPINMMEMEHELVGKNMEEIRKITHNYTLPEGACASYQQLFRLLAEFEEDLQIHIHLENNILFPKAVALEKTM